MNDNRIILEEFTRIGDRVIASYTEKDTRESNQIDRNVPNGTLGTIVGYVECINYYDVNDYPNPPIGKYRSNGIPYIKWDNGYSNSSSVHYVCFENDIDGKIKKQRSDDSEYRSAFNTITRIDDLPETKYKLGNVVLLKQGTNYWSGKIAVINRVNCYTCGEFCNDGITPYPIYHVTFEDGTSASFNDNDISELVSLGNYWAWQNDRTKLVFKDICEEISFHYSVGVLKQVRNEHSLLYSFTLQEVIEELENNKGQCIDLNVMFYCFLKNKPLGNRRSGYFNLLKFDDGFEELAERCRQISLNGLNELV